MSDDAERTIEELEADLAALAQSRYGLASGSPEVEAAAVAAGDVEYLQAHIRCLQAKLDQRNDDASWMAPTARNSPAQALQRIKALCTMFPDLYSAVFAVAATHVSINREMLAMAIKQFRRDADTLSNEDMVSLLVSVVNGGNQAFEAVLRTRKSSERKTSAALPWGRDEA